MKMTTGDWTSWSSTERTQNAYNSLCSTKSKKSAATLSPKQRKEISGMCSICGAALKNTPYFNKYYMKKNYDRSTHNFILCLTYILPFPVTKKCCKFWIPLIQKINLHCLHFLFIFFKRAIRVHLKTHTAAERVNLYPRWSHNLYLWVEMEWSH